MSLKRQEQDECMLSGRASARLWIAMQVSLKTYLRSINESEGGCKRWSKDGSLKLTSWRAGLTHRIRLGLIGVYFRTHTRPHIGRRCEFATATSTSCTCFFAYWTAGLNALWNRKDTMSTPFTAQILATMVLGLLVFWLWYRSRETRRPSLHSVAILVLGDIGRSPRMMYHAESFANIGFKTYLIGNNGTLSSGLHHG